MEKFNKRFKNTAFACLLAAGVVGIGSLHAGLAAEGDAETPEIPKIGIGTINYEGCSMEVQTNGNDKVYYSDSKKKTWTLLEGTKINDNTLRMDISWISQTKDYELNLKGSENEEIVTVKLPKRNNALKVKFDKVEGVLDFINEENAQEFEWKKATSTGGWKKAPVQLLDNITDSAVQFKNTVDLMRVKGGKISVRIPQVLGQSASEVGKRPSRTVNVSISKRGNAPSVKVVSKKLTVRTSTAMEYCIAPTTAGSIWKACEKNMLISDFSEDALKKDITIAVRKKETEKAPYSKTAYVEVPSQREAPLAADIQTTAESEKKFAFSIPKASDSAPYQYVAVKASKVSGFDFSKASWKNLKSSKVVKFSEKSYPKGSKIYVRLMGNDKTKTKDLLLPSKYVEVDITYKAAEQETPPKS